MLEQKFRPKGQDLVLLELSYEIPSVKHGGLQQCWLGETELKPRAQVCTSDDESVSDLPSFLWRTYTDKQHCAWKSNYLNI